MSKKVAEDFIGQKFNNLTILEISDKRFIYGKLKLCLCRCDCGNQIECISYKVINGIKKDCGCYWSKIKINFVSKNITLGFWTKLKNSAKGRNIDFEITPEYLQLLWDNQNGKCYFSGRDLYISITTKEYKDGMDTCSVDRINNKLGYIIGNIRLVYKDINRSKRCISDDIYLDFCKKVRNYHVK